MPSGAVHSYGRYKAEHLSYLAMRPQIQTPVPSPALSLKNRPHRSRLIQRVGWVTLQPVLASSSPDEAVVALGVSPLQDDHKAYQDLPKQVAWMWLILWPDLWAQQQPHTQAHGCSHRVFPWRYNKPSKTSPLKGPHSFWSKLMLGSTGLRILRRLRNPWGYIPQWHPGSIIGPNRLPLLCPARQDLQRRKNKGFRCRPPPAFTAGLMQATPRQSGNLKHSF